MSSTKDLQAVDLVLSVQGLHKSYPGVQALTDIDLDIRKGEIHALVGQNGAGKSTLIRLLSGVEQPDGGRIELEGTPVHFKAPQDSQRLGIHTIYQELSLMPNLSVAENIFLSDLPTGFGATVDWRRARRQAKELLEWLGFNIDVDRRIHSLTIAQQQGVELAKALRHGRAPIILLDEPTATLPPRDVQRLLTILQELQAHGVSLIYISHRLEEVFEICQRITVLRDGQKVGTQDVDQTTPEDIVRQMIGKRLQTSKEGQAVDANETKPRLGTGGDPDRVALSVENLNEETALKDIGFKLHQGEVLGVAGLVGSGQSELAACLFGARERTSGEISVKGHSLKLRGPGDAIRAGIGLIPQDRKTEGLVLGMSVSENLTLPNMSDFSRYSVVSQSRQHQTTHEMANSMNMKINSTTQQVRTLSGGTQQKVVLAKWLVSKAKILIFDEPTRGIDVGAKEEIYELIKSFVQEGGSVLLISSDLAETMMCDRVMVIARGQLVKEFHHEDIDARGDVIADQCY